MGSFGTLKPPQVCIVPIGSLVFGPSLLILGLYLRTLCRSFMQKVVIASIHVQAAKLKLILQVSHKQDLQALMT